MTACECGCGQETAVYQGKSRRFISGHNTIGNKHGLGYKHTDLAKKKISKSSRGRQPSLGHKHSEETKQKMRESSSGEKASNWQGGISFEPYCPKFNNSFKESVREKFGRVCFLCGVPENGTKLSVHHVNYDKSCLCSEIECEFVPLCRRCHSKTNHNRDYYENMIIAKLGEMKMSNMEMI